MKTVLMSLGQLICWTIALFVLIPPIPSDAGQTYSFLPHGVIAAVFLFLHRFLAIKTRRSGKEAIVFALLEAACLFVFGMVLFDRMHVR